MARETRKGTRMVRINPCIIEWIRYSFPEGLMMTGKVVSMDVAPIDAIGLSFMVIGAEKSASRIPGMNREIRMGIAVLSLKT